MKRKILLTSLFLTLTACKLPELPVVPPTPLPTVTPTIGTAPTLTPDVERCAPHAPLVNSNTAKFGDGKDGTLFKQSDTNPNNYAFLLKGNIRSYKFVEICDLEKCQKLPWVACANPDEIGKRGHYKGPLNTLNKKQPWVAKFGKSKLQITDKKRTD